MAIDRKFFSVSACSLDRLAEVATASVVGAPVTEAVDAAPLDEAATGDLTFMTGEPDDAVCSRLHGVVVITTAQLAQRLPESCAALVCAKPRLGFANALALMVDEIADSHDGLSEYPCAVSVGTSASIAANVALGEGTRIDQGVVIHQGVEVGRNCHIGANAVLSHCRIGDGVSVGANTVIGAAGFGFEISSDGPVVLPHVGTVEIGPQTMIGAGCTIDRGTLASTRIGRQVMIDNLVHIAHNCVIEDRAVLAAQVGLAGGVQIGSGAMLAGQAGVSSQIRVGKGAIVMGQSGVTKDVPDEMTVVGFPAEEAREVWRERAALRRLLRPAGKQKG